MSASHPSPSASASASASASPSSEHATIGNDKCVVHGCLEPGRPKFCALHSTSLQRRQSMFLTAPSPPAPALGGNDATARTSLVRRTSVFSSTAPASRHIAEEGPPISDPASSTAAPRDASFSVSSRSRHTTSSLSLPTCVVTGCSERVSTFGYCEEHLNLYTGLTPARASFLSSGDAMSATPSAATIRENSLNSSMLLESADAPRLLAALPQSQLLAESQRLLALVHQFRSLLDIAPSLTSARSLDPNTVLPLILDCSSSLVHAQSWSLFLADPESNDWCLVAQQASLDFESDSTWIQTVLARTLQSRTPLRWSRSSCHDPLDSLASAAIPSSVFSVLCVPMIGNADQAVVSIVLALNRCDKAGSSTAALLSASHANLDDFTNSDQHLVQFVVMLAGNTLQHISHYEDATASRRQAEVMLYLQRELNAENGVEHVIRKIFEAASTLIHADRIVVVLVDRARHEVVVRFPDESSSSKRLPLQSSGLIGHVIEQRLSVRVDCVGADSRYGPEFFVIGSASSDLPEVTDRALLATPILDHDGVCIAAIQATKADGTVFTEDDLSLLESLTSTAGLALRKAQLYDASLQAQRQTQALLRLVKAGSSWQNVSVEALLERVTHIAYDLLDADRVLIYFVDQTRGDMWCLLNKFNYLPSSTAALRIDETMSVDDVTVNPDVHSFRNRSKTFSSPSMKPASAIPVATLPRASSQRVSLCETESSSLMHSNLCWTVSTGFGLAGLVARTRTFEVVADATTDARHDPSYDRQFEYHTRALLCAPILDADGQAMAVLEARNRKSGRGTFDDSDVELLRAFCTEVSSLLRKHVTDTILERLAISGIRKLAEGGGDSSSLRRRQMGAQRASLISIRLPGASASDDAGALSGDSVEDKCTGSVGGVVSHVGAHGANKDVHSMLAAYMPPNSNSNWRIATPSRSLSTLASLTPGSRPPMLRTNSSSGVVSAFTTRSLLSRGSFGALASPNSHAIPPLTPSSAIAATMNSPISPQTPLSALASPSSHANPAAAALTRTLQRSVRNRKMSIGSTSAFSVLADSPQALADTNSVLPLASSVSCTATSDEQCVASVTVVSDDHEHDLSELPPPQVTFDNLKGGECDSTVTQSSDIVAIDSGASDNLQSPVAKTWQPWLFELRAFVLSGQMSISEAVSCSLNSPLVAGVNFSALRSLDFSVFDYAPDELVPAVLLMFEDLGLLSECQTPRLIAEQFVTAIRIRYRDENSFHNFYHAVAVLHFMYYSLIHSGALVYLNKMDVVGLMVAAFCHDVAHPGHTNSFEINSRSALALRYHDHALLENYHAFVTFQVLRDPRCDLFANLPSDDVRVMRKVIINAIMATDMADHFALCKKLDLLLASAEPVALAASVPPPVAPAVGNVAVFSSELSSVASSFTAAASASHNDSVMSSSTAAAMVACLPPSRATLFDPNKPDDRQLVCATLIHAADLSGQVYKSVTLAQEWERRISLEFQSQAAKEAHLGLPVAPFMTNLDDVAHRARLQISFIDFVLTPLWKAVARTFPPLRPCLDNMAKNRRHYEELAQRIEVARAAAQAAAARQVSLVAGAEANANADADACGDVSVNDHAAAAVQVGGARVDRAARPLGGWHGFSVEEDV